VPVPLWRRVIAGPSTRDGRFSAWLTGAAMGVVVGGLAVADVPDWGWGSQLAVGLTGLLAVLTAVVAGGIAVRAIVRGDRSIVLLAPLLFGGVCLSILVGELFPH
jgi:hypothetical protein